MTDPTSLPIFPSPADQHPLREVVYDVIQKEGFRPEIDADGDVSFKVEGQQLFVHCTEGELPVMRVFGQWQIADTLPTDLMMQYQAANDLSLRLNIVKIGISGGTLVVTCEHLVTADHNLEQLVELSYQLVLTAVQMWHQIMLGQDVFGDFDGQAAGQFDGQVAGQVDGQV